MDDLSLKKRLGEPELRDLSEIQHLINKYRSLENTKENQLHRNELIKMIAVRHVTTKGYMTPEVQKFLHPEHIELVRDLNTKIWGILKPVYDGLTNMAVEHCEKWFISLMKKKGLPNPKMYGYQKDLAGWLLSAIIKHELPEAIYTLVISRGSGKTYTLAIVGFFLMLFHDKYIIHNGFGDYVEICTAPQEEQIQSFIKYFHEFLDLCTTREDISYVAQKESDESTLGLYIKYKSVKRIELMKTTGGSHSTVFFSLGSKSIESKHGQLLLSDESKFLSKKVIHGSMLPTMGNRMGIFVELSSAHDEWSEFQNQVEQNIAMDKKDHDEFNTKCLYSTWGDKELDINAVDKVKTFNGRRHFEQHWEDMIMQNPGYATAVARELQAVGNNRDDREFATMYDNKFLSRKTSSFFDINDLSKEMPKIFESEHVSRYINNPNYVIISGWDIGVTGDSSVLTIKALESGFGENRKTKLLYLYLMNPDFDKKRDSVLRQCERVCKLIKIHNIQALTIDESGVGKSAKNYIVDILTHESYYDLMEDKIKDLVITIANRGQLLEYYYKRIQSGLEIFQHIPKQWFEEDYLKRSYMNCVKSAKPDDMWVKFVHEHVKFTRAVIKDEKTGMTKLSFLQSEENYLHDDNPLSSALCSWNIYEYPDITARTRVITSHNGRRRGVSFNRRF